jgi:hypothetical protein
MKISRIGKWTASLVLGGMALVSSASAISFDITSLNSNSDPDAPVDWFSVGLMLDGAGKATFSLSNLPVTGNGTKISKIWLGTTGAANDPNDGFFSFFKPDALLSGIGTFNYSVNYNPNSNVGGVPWGVEVTEKSVTGSDPSVLNPGESLNITFSLVNSLTTEQQLIDAFYTDPRQLGIAFHAQALPGGYSEKYEALPKRSIGPIIRTPDGGTTLSLMGLALSGLAAGRRFLKK